MILQLALWFWQGLSFEERSLSLMLCGWKFGLSVRFLGSFPSSASLDSVTGLQYHLSTSVCPVQGHYSYKMWSGWCPSDLWDVITPILSTHVVHIPVVKCPIIPNGIQFRFLNTGKYDAAQSAPGWYPRHLPSNSSPHPRPASRRELGFFWALHVLRNLFFSDTFPIWCSSKEILLTHSIIQQLFIEHLLCIVHYVKHIESAQV